MQRRWDIAHEVSGTLKLCNQVRKMLTNCQYVENEVVEVQGVKILATPCMPAKSAGLMAWHRDQKTLEKHWKQLSADSKDVDIILTHSPPYGVLDR